MFPAGPHKKQTTCRYRRQTESSLICEGQYNQSIQDLPLSWRRSVKSCQSPPEQAGKCVLPPEPDWPEHGTGAGLDPAGCQPLHAGLPRRGGHSPAPQCTAKRVTRSGGSRLDRYGPAPPSPSSLLGVARILICCSPLSPFSCHGPDSRRWDYRPTYPRRELSSWRGSGSLRSRGALEGWDCWDFVPFNSLRITGAARTAVALRLTCRDIGQLGQGAEEGGDSRSEVPAVKRHSLALGCQKHGGPPRLFRWPESLTRHFLFSFKQRFTWFFFFVR